MRSGQVRRAGSGSGPGGRCLVAAAAAITRALSAGGGLTAAAAASRAVASRRLAISRAHSSHRARWRSKLARSGGEIASIAYGPARV